MKKHFLSFVVLLLLLGTILPTGITSAAENDIVEDQQISENSTYTDEDENVIPEDENVIPEDENVIPEDDSYENGELIDLPIEDQLENSDMVSVTISSEDGETIVADVPKEYEQEYLAKLEDPEFKKSEIEKSLGTNLDTSFNTFSLARYSAPKPYVKYFKKKEVIRIIDSIDNSLKWDKYISNPLSDAAIATAISIVKKNKVLGAAIGLGIWGATDLRGRQEAWWKDTAILILKKKITGVKLTVTPNNKTNYPAVYRTYKRY